MPCVHCGLIARPPTPGNPWETHFPKTKDQGLIKHVFGHSDGDNGEDATVH